MATRYREEKHQEDFDRSTHRTVKRKVVSEFTTYSEHSKQPTSTSKSAICENLTRRNIAYNPHIPYQPFSFEVERMAPSLNFFRIKVKIAHFSLTVSAAKLSQLNVLASHQMTRGCFANIYSLNLGEEILCLKSFDFQEHTSFQKLFPRVVKEWSILRICEALECAPYIPKSLGFDLLIYDNCIQYATEMGQKKNDFSIQDASHLKEQLALMHSFKIMHLDIKPQNIVFSLHFGKPVFIDFGFSQIIQEEVGLKTLIKFRGTPNFCSSEMLSIMLEYESQGYVDLYYNDSNSLELVFKYNKASTSLQFKDLENQNETLKISGNLSLINIVYALYAFQYYYIESNLLKARQALHLCLSIDESNFKRILLFIRKTMRLIFIKEIFEKDLGKYFTLPEYRQIKEEQRANIGKFFYKNIANQYTQIEEETVNNSWEFHILSFNGGAELTQSFQHYLSILLSLSELEDNTVTNFVAIAFQCIRFDVRDLEVSEKKQIADKMNPLLLKYLHRDIPQFIVKEKGDILDQEKEALKPVKVLLLLIFEFCLTHQSQQTKWVKRHIFDVCQQLILVDICFLEHIEKLSQYVEESITEPKEEALTMLQFSRLSNTAKIIESEHIEKHELLQKEFFSLTWIWITKFKSSSQYSQEKEIIAIRKVLFLFQQLRLNNTEYPHHQEDIMKDIQDLEIRKYLLLCLTDHKINHYFDTMSHQQIFEISQFAKHSSDLRNLDLLSSITITMKTLVGANNIAGVQAFCKHIQSVINCNTISKSLNMKEKFLRQSLPDNIFIENQVKLVLTRYRKSSKKDNGNGQILEMLLAIDKKKLKVSEQVKQDLLQLYILYRQQNLLKQSRQNADQIFVKQFANVFSEIKLQFYFFRFGDLTKEIFLNNLKTYQQQTFKIAELIQQNSQVNDFKYLYSKYKVRLYQFYYYLHHQQAQLCLTCLTQVQKILRCFNLNSLILETMKVEIKISLSWQKMALIQSAVYRLYNYCCQINYKSFYLLQKNLSESFTSLVVFQSTNPYLFYSLLNQLTLFLVAHPIQCYFMYLLKVLEKIFVFKPEYSRALHYSHFANNETNLKENPYLLVFYAFSLRNQELENQVKLFKKIVLNCDRLNPYAKTKILEKHFAVYFDYLSDRGQSQRIFIFRRIKHFIGQVKRSQTFRLLFKIKKWKVLKYEMLKNKIKHYRQYLV